MGVKELSRTCDRGRNDGGDHPVSQPPVLQIIAVASWPWNRPTGFANQVSGG